MKINVIGIHELSESDIERWAELQSSNPELGNPYFHPEFARAVASVCPDARVAVLEDGGRIQAFFPFQRDRFGIGKPLGRIFSDYQGVIAAPGTPYDAQELVRRSDLAVWEFDHLLASQSPFRRFHQRLSESPVIDLARGFEAYLQQRKQAGSERLVQLQRKARKLEREIGGVEFVCHRADPNAFEYVIQGKSKQCQRTGVFDFFNRLDWTVPLLQRILQTQTPSFSGSLSILYAKERVIAAHLGMRGTRVLHWWFPVYDPEDELAKYSPGGLLLLKLAEHTAAQGIELLDMGKGDDAYKASFQTGVIPLAEGAVETPSFGALLRRTHLSSEQWLRRSPSLSPLRNGVRALRKLKTRLVPERKL